MQKKILKACRNIIILVAIIAISIIAGKFIVESQAKVGAIKAVEEDKLAFWPFDDWFGGGDNDEEEEEEEEQDPCAKGHAYRLVYEHIGDPKCTDPTIRRYECTRCGDTTTEQEGPYGHDYYPEPEYEGGHPVCTVPLREIYTCKICGYKKIITYSCEHTYGPVIVTQPVTCTQDGKSYTVCGICGDTMNFTTPSLGHVWNSVPIKEATCTEPGSERRTCSRCGTVEEVSVPSLGHDWSEASCTEPSTCKRCGATRGSAGGHIGGTHENDGVCTKCHTKYQNHTLRPWVNDGKGNHVRRCKACSYIETEPHNFVNGVCSVCGVKEEKQDEVPEEEEEEEEEPEEPDDEEEEEEEESPASDKEVDLDAYGDYNWDTHMPERVYTESGLFPQQDNEHHSWVFCDQLGGAVKYGKWDKGTHYPGDESITKLPVVGSYGITNPFSYVGRKVGAFADYTLYLHNQGKFPDQLPYISLITGSNNQGNINTDHTFYLGSRINNENQYIKYRSFYSCFHLGRWRLRRGRK